ncbi:small ribosomal subunit protein mS33-like [Crassostrea virginica]|uniref:Small ribosomal subunit protein mS33 n=1 Tax=Crassostrea virginica TaxID=6565 RepID=A0A8B8BBF8_CRAVI|nr:28S ribosomal protein S33, mitochondrial-like [Crassostrea virginica]XP_022300572.1 28S ribosomal protein S33, mitochondrial-like [Crassostrea virginica]|mmetsp:Transcript_5579/g.9978  ORF Transcript_5579/g.9978 Transcript_5579/m.9978 type:complete len:102 (+) Transcript_5579:54-359(+)
MSKYAQRMAHLSARIFGEYTRERTYTANRIINEFKSLPKYKDPQVVKYYPKHVEASMLLLRLREHGLYRDFHADFLEEFEAQRASRGKGRKKPGEEEEKEE